MGSRLRSIGIAFATLAVGLTAGYFAPKESQNSSRLPTSEVIIERESYILAYDGRSKQARWVYEQLTSDSLEGKVDRGKFHFQEDPLVPISMRSTKEDYVGSGFDRGHLCPAADAKANESVMKETFYLSNVSPQCPQFNRGFWLKLENHVRALAKQYGAVDVFTGGLYLPREEKDGKRFVRYQVIGQNDVAVPTHYFKIICDGNGNSLESYILPNEPISGEIPLKDFMTTVEKVERAAGIVFSVGSR